MGIWVGRYSIVGGEVQEHGPWLVERRRVHDDEAVRLIVMAEPVDARSAEFAHEIADAVAALFRRESLSLTGGLLRALRQAHGNLAEWNRRSLREHQVAVGVTCVAIRDGEATVAQVGPSAVYVRSGDGVRRIVTAGEAAAVPLGGSEAIEPAFSRVELADEPLLLLSSAVEDAIGIDAIAASMALGPERALSDLFLRTRGVADMSAALIAELDLAEDDEGTGAPVDVFDEQLDDSRGGLPYERTDEVPLIPEADSGTTRAPARTAGRARSFPAVRRDRLAGVGPQAWRRRGAIALAVVALAVLAWVTLPGLLSEDAGARLEEAIATAEQELSAAEAQPDLVEGRARLEAALAAIEQARSIEDADPRVAALEARAAAVTAAIDLVVEVSGLRSVQSFEGVITTPLAPAALAAGGDTVWMLDGEGGRVFALDPAGVSAPVLVLRAGTDYGGVVADIPLSMAWDQAGGRLLVLDRARTLFSVTLAAPPFALPLRGAEDMGSPRAIAAYDGSLYVLDAGAGEVWRYAPAGDGFDSERAELLGGVDLANARGLAIDGDVFVLEDGALRRFSLGDEQPPLLRGVDRPPEQAAGVVEDVPGGRFYVADGGGERVLVSDRDGEFLAQFRHPSFFDLRGLALSEDQGTLFVLTGDGVFAFEPPDPPAP